MKKTKTQYGDYCEFRNGKLYAAVRIGGKKKRRLVDSKLEARQWAHSQLDKAAALSGEVRTFHDLALWYQDRHLVAPRYENGKRIEGLRTWKQQRRMLVNLLKVFGDYELSEITVEVLDRFKRREQKFTSVTTVNRKFALMRTMFKKAVRRKWMTENPFDLEPELFQVALENKRHSQLNDRIVKRLLARSRKSKQPLLHYVLLVLAHTGARPSEVFPFEDNGDEVLREPLTWKRILDNDFKVVELVSYKGRSRHSRFVPTSRELEKGLRELHSLQQPAPEDKVFNVTTFKRSWSTLCKSVGVSNTRMRDLRHYFNSYLVGRSDINDMERMLLLGHTDMVTNARYSKLDPAFVSKFRKEGP